MIEKIKKVWVNSGTGWSEKQDFAWIVKWMTSELIHHNWEPVDADRDASGCLYFSAAGFMGYEDIRLLDNSLYYTMSNEGHEDEEAYQVMVWFNTISDAIRFWKEHIRITIRLGDLAITE
jgi:hypothetical protein